MMEFKESFPSRKRRRPSFAPRAGKRSRRLFRRLASRGELKFFDTTKAATAAATTGTLLDDSLNHVAQDASENGRIGRKIIVTRLHIRGSWQFASGPALANMDQRLRIIVFVDKQANGAAPTLADVVSTAGTVSIDAFRNLSNVSRFAILHDRLHDVRVNAVLQDSATTGDNIPQNHTWRLNKKLNLIIEFDSSAADGSIATITSNNICVMAICAATATAPTVAYTARIRFRDG